ncbi:hypothetical protein R3P38DRAFT_2838158 [Favolaschia claudopus]|uniref:Uncharacterized protein n=1 Tax=Favolaschia claudopus TaxID=2862362 RepID=A0AAW0E7R6_9AGAR
MNPDSTTMYSEGSEYGAASVSNEKGETARGESDQFIPILLPHIQRYSPVPRTPPQPPIEKPAQVHKGKSSKYEKYEKSKGGEALDIDEWRVVVESERCRPIDVPFPEDNVQDAASSSGTSTPALEEAIFREFLNSGTVGNNLSVGCEGLDASIPKTPADQASLEGGLNGVGDFPQTVGGVLGLPGFDGDRASPSQSLDIRVAAGHASMTKSPSEDVYASKSSSLGVEIPTIVINVASPTQPCFDGVVYIRDRRRSLDYAPTERQRGILKEIFSGQYVKRRGSINPTSTEDNVSK